MLHSNQSFPLSIDEREWEWESERLFDWTTSIIWWSSNPFDRNWTNQWLCSKLVRDYMIENGKEMQAWRDIDWSVVNAYELLFDSNKHLVFLSFAPCDAVRGHCLPCLLFDERLCCSSSINWKTGRFSSLKKIDLDYSSVLVFYFSIELLKIWIREINVCVQEKTRLERERERERETKRSWEQAQTWDS